MLLKQMKKLIGGSFKEKKLLKMLDVTSDSLKTKKSAVLCALSTTFINLLVHPEVLLRCFWFDAPDIGYPSGSSRK